MSDHAIGHLTRCVPLPIVCRKRIKRDRKRVTVLPEILASSMRARSDIRSPTIRQACLGVTQEPRMPQSEQNPGRERRLPVRLRTNDLVHEREQSVRIILDLDIDIEFDVLVFRLSTSRNQTPPRITVPELAFMSNSIVSAKVGMGCLGSFLVLTCCIPSFPNQFRSLICPVDGLVSIPRGINLRDPKKVITCGIRGPSQG
jgi:hypothetical protein